MDDTNTRRYKIAFWNVMMRGVNAGYLIWSRHAWKQKTPEEGIALQTFPIRDIKSLCISDFIIEGSS